jgi:hypothetical protein
MNKAVLLLLLSTVGVGLVTLHLVRELRAERSRASALQIELDQLRGMPTAASYKSESADAALPASSAAASSPFGDPVQAARPRTDAGATAAAPAAAATFTLMNGGSREEQMKLFREQRERQRALMQDPAYRAAMIDQQMDSMRMFQRGLDRELDLPDEQYERLLELQAEQQLRGSELMDPSSNADGPVDPAAWQEQARKMQEIQQRNEKEMKALLGEQKYRQYQEYQQSAGARAEVTQLNMMLAEAGMPMREDQIRPLIRTIHESQMSSPQFVTGALSAVAASTPADFQRRQLDLMREQNKRIRDAAARVLNDEQVQILEQQHEDRLRMHENQLRMMQAQTDAIARGELPAPQAGQLGIAVSEGYFVPAR